MSIGIAALDIGIAPGLSALAETLRRSTVKILDPGQPSGSGIGSGVIWDDGLVITNAHVLGGQRPSSGALSGGSGSVSLEASSGRRFGGVVERVDWKRDLAAVRVSPPSLEPPVLEPLPRRSGQVRVGELVVAVGHPFGITGAIATGIIHAIGQVPGLAALPWIQADIRLAPGNSGGPLADATGKLIGINSMIARGLGLAIPAASVEEFLSGDLKQPVIGITVEPVGMRLGRRKTMGLYISSVVPGAPAEQAGLQPGDVVLGCGDNGTRAAVDLVAAIQQAVGKSIHLEVLRAGRRMGFDVGVGA